LDFTGIFQIHFVRKIVQIAPIQNRVVDKNHKTILWPRKKTRGKARGNDDQKRYSVLGLESSAKPEKEKERALLKSVSTKGTQRSGCHKHKKSGKKFGERRCSERPSFF